MANKAASNSIDKLWYKELDTRAHGALLATVFGAAPPGEDGPDPTWISSGFCDESGRCIACIDTASLEVRLDGTMSRMGAIRLVGVHPDWRGLGLFRDLMARALAWCDAHTSGLTLLYAEESDLYRRFGFESVAQHAVHGPAPRPVGRAASRPLSWRSDAAFIQHRLAARSAVSDQCAIVGAPGLFFEALAKDDAIVVAHLDDLDAIVAYEAEDAVLVLVDIVAAAVPSLGSILGALGQPFDEVRTLFPPDKLDWSGHAIADDTGLMLRGPMPGAMGRPFMLPPTTEF